MAVHYQNYYYQNSYLNPFVPEFHPIFPSNNTINSTYYNYIYHNHRYTNNNTNNYCSFYYQNYPFEINANNFFHLHHQLNNNNNNLNYHGQAQDYTMQRQQQLGHPVATSPRMVHFRSSPSSHIRPNNTRASPQDGSGASGGRRSSSRWVGCSGSGSSSSIVSNRRSDYYCERKKGFNNFNDLGKIKRVGNRKKESNEMFIRVKPHGVESSAMIRNIPNQYTREMLIKYLDEFCRIENQRLLPSNNDDHQPLAFDFLYLPMDFKSGANKGYAFVNFTHPNAVWKLHLAYNNQRWEFCKSHKICEINYATIQGKENLVEHFGLSKFICDHEDYLPVCFNPPRDGSGASVTETTVGKRLSPKY